MLLLMFDHQPLDFGAQLQNCKIALQVNTPFNCDQNIMDHFFVYEK